MSDFLSPTYTTTGESGENVPILPGFGGPPGTNTTPTTPSAPAADPGTMVGYLACRQKCEDNALLAYPSDAEKRTAYYYTCIVQCGAAGGDPAQSHTVTACEGCTGVSTFPQCISCIGEKLTNGLKVAGVNIAIFLILLFGIYMLFSDEINQAAGAAIKGAASA